MQSDYTWKNSRRRPSYQVSKREHVGRFLTIALVVALLVHGGLYLFFGQIEWKPDLREVDEWLSERFAVDPVELADSPEMLEPVSETELPAPLEEPISLDPDELLDMVRDQDVDITPELLKPENLVIAAPALEGLPDIEEEVELFKPKELVIEDTLRGDAINTLKEIPDGQLVVDPGAQIQDMVDPDNWNKAQLAKGFEGGDPDGLLKNYSDIEDLIKSPFGSLGDKTRPARLGSDLLFDFDSATLREAAYLSLMRLGILVATHHDTYFVIEGHTDTFGNESYNQRLGLDRAQAVRDWIIEELALESDRIFATSAGMSRPIVTDPDADRDQQSLNRRVEIHMRKQKPDLPANSLSPMPSPHSPQTDRQTQPRVNQTDERRAEIVTPTREPTEETRPTKEPEQPRRAILVTPKRAIPVDPSQLEKPDARPPRRAVPVR